MAPQSPSSESGLAAGYLHGFTPEEQDRLYKQARVLEGVIYSQVDFSKETRIIEVGCGVGAQTEILLERFPHLQIQGIDASESQIERARQRLSLAVAAGRARFDVGDALNLSYPENQFDGAFICWLLEHVQKPVEILSEIRRVLRPNGKIFCNEVLNATFYLNPYSPATLQYWFALNDWQWSMKGDPFVGGKLANYLLDAGYQNLRTDVINLHYDSRTPKKRAEIIEWWTGMLLSGAPALLEAGKVSPETVTEMKAELTRLKGDPQAVFFYSFVQAQAQAF